MLVSRNDPWVQTIRMLSSGARRPGDGAVTSVAKQGAPSGHNATSSANRSPHLVVRLVERTTSSTVAIAWGDSTRCFYGEQKWRAATARISGVCALSGAPIKRGDRIFHPQRSKPVPVNARAMILEAALNAIEPLQTKLVNGLERDAGGLVMDATMAGKKINNAAVERAATAK
jgi:Domain of unknown function (DUF3331)